VSRRSWRPRGRRSGWQTSSIEADPDSEAVIDDRHRLDPSTIERGRAHIAEIRAQLARQSPATPTGRRAPQPTRPDEATAGSEPGAESAERMSDDRERVAEWSAERMSAEMAAGAERDLLVHRVAQLEREVDRLRAALAAVLAAASDGIRSDDAGHTPSDVEDLRDRS